MRTWGLGSRNRKSFPGNREWHALIGTTLGDYVVAYALPDTERGGQ